MRLTKEFVHLKPHIDSFLRSCPVNKKNVFIMMRYQDTKQFKEIETAIITSLTRSGLNAHLAKDHQFLPVNLWDNICIYMLACDFGIAVFEEIDSREFNPNIAIEVGFMKALGKECLLLKDKRMLQMPTDFCGHLYRAFDTYHIKKSISGEISNWIEDLRTRGIL
jgi:hypothetical protein